MKNIDITPLKNRKMAFVMSGGVVKAAAWHLGVALGLEELGIQFKSNNTEPSDYEISTYVGSSAGSLVGLYFTAGYRAVDIIDATLNKKNAHLRTIRYKDIFSVKKPFKNIPRSDFYKPLENFPFVIRKILSPIATYPGLFTTQGIKKYVDDEIITSNEFSDYKADLFVVATQLDHSRKVIFGKYNYPNPRHDSTSVYYTQIPISDAIAASMSVPPFFTPHPIENKVTSQIDYYIDGEIRETLSTHVAVDNQCDFIISSWTHTPYHFHDEIGSLVNYGLPAIALQSIYLMIQKKIIASRAEHRKYSDVLDTVNIFMKDHKFTDRERLRLLGILEKKLNFNPRIKFIDIYPKHENYKLFFKSPFSLNPKTTSEIVNWGYKRTLEVFRTLEV